MSTMNISGDRTIVQRYLSWRSELNVSHWLMLSVTWACFMGLLAQVRVPLPFTPVPFTMQVFGVFLGAVLLGPRWGPAAQVLYVGLGILGIHWFQGSNGGWAYFVGPTGGYLLAYPVAALFIGMIVARQQGPRPARAILAMMAGLAIIYTIGMLWLATYLDVSIARAFLLGVAPFIAIDLAKAIAAAFIARPFLTRPA